jgi:hypothetical protein
LLYTHTHVRVTVTYNYSSATVWLQAHTRRLSTLTHCIKNAQIRKRKRSYRLWTSSEARTIIDVPPHTARQNEEITTVHRTNKSSLSIYMYKYIYIYIYIFMYIETRAQITQSANAREQTKQRLAQIMKAYYDARATTTTTFPRYNKYPRPLL